MVLQTDSESTIRAVSFASKTVHDNLEAKSLAHTPVRLRNSRMDAKTNTVLMDNYAQTDEAKIKFQPKDLLQTEHASLSSVHCQQLITIKAKVTKVSATKKITGNGVKQKANCLLSDPSCTIKVTLWGDKRKERPTNFINYKLQKNTSQINWL